MTETVVNVRDRDWRSMSAGVEFERWPGDKAPEAGTRVVVFDSDLEFTQHGVVHVAGMRVRLGPAIPWPKRDDDQG